jgi:hypothetical protein
MDSYRLQINNYDESSVTATELSTGAVGYTVVKSPKGPANSRPVLVTSVSQLYNTFGEPSSEYPELYEAATFIANGHRLYVCSAGGGKNTGTEDVSTAKANYIIVATEGNFLSNDQLEYNADVLNFIEEGDSTAECSPLSTEVSEDVDVRTGDHGYALKGKLEDDNVVYFKLSKVTSSDNIVNGKLTLPSLRSSYHLSGLPTGFDNTDITLTIDRSEVKGADKVLGGIGYISAESGSSQIMTSITKGDVDTSSYYQVLYLTGASESETAAELFASQVKTLYESNSNLLNLTLEDIVSIPADHIKALILTKDASAETLTVSFTMKETTAANPERDIDVRNTLQITVNDITIQGVLGGGSASSCFNTETNSSYKQDYIAIYEKNGNGAFVTADLTETEVSDIREEDIATSIVIPAGIRATATDELLSTAWSYAAESEFDDVAVFFDSERHGTTPSGRDFDMRGGFSELKASRPLCNFIYNYTVAKTGGKLKDANTCAIGNNFYTISNLKKITYTQSNGSKATSFYSPMTGAYASMIATIIDNAYGGIAPMFLNSNGMGGQLSFPVGTASARMAYNYSSDDQKALEKKNYNPVIYDNTYGTMVVAQRTNASGVLTDWSYIGHVCSFLTLQREIRTNVMIPQLGKANNDYYRSLRAEQVSQLLRYRLEGSNAIWNAATVDTSTNTGVNDTQAQKAKKFIINVRVKPEPYSEYVVLNFTNYNDSSTSEATVV